MAQLRPLIPAALGMGLFSAAALVGPLIAAGGVLAVGLAAAIYVWPIVGLSLMLLSGSALQILGSEQITGLPASLGKIAGAVTLLVWLLRSILLRIPVTWSPQMPALIGFIFVVWASSFFTPDRAEAMEGVFRYAQLVLLTLMIANIAGESERALDLSVMAFTACMTLSALIGLAEFTLPGLTLESDDPSQDGSNIGAVVDRDSLEGVEIKRVSGGVAEANWFSYMLVAVVPLNLYLFNRFTGTAARLAILAATTLQSVGIVISFTRSAIIALAVTVIYLVIRGRLPLKPLLLAGFIGAAGFVAWNPAGLERIYSIDYARKGSTNYRAFLLEGAASLVQQRPVRGWGYNQFGPNFMVWLRTRPDLPEEITAWERQIEDRVASGAERAEWIMPHNTLLQVWVEFGLAGVLGFGALLLLVFRDLRQVARAGDPSQRLLAECLIGSALGFVVCAAFGHLALAKIVWILAGYAAALRRVAFEPMAAVAAAPRSAAP